MLTRGHVTTTKELCRRCVADTTSSRIPRGDSSGVRGRCDRCGKRRKTYSVRFTFKFAAKPRES